jgi:hypothetical protein
MDYADARTAMTIADMAGPEHTHDELRVWVHREIWADSLGLTAIEVLEHVSCSPAWAVGEKGTCEHDRGYFPQKRRQPPRKAVEAAAERDDPEAGG